MPRNLAHVLHPRRALGRLAIGLALGVAAGFLLARRFPLAVAALGGWDLGGLAVLLLAWGRIAGADARQTQRRAASEDPGRTLVYALVCCTSAASLIAATPLARGAKGLAPQQSTLLVALCLATVALSWALTHTAFALRYAHLYYREDAEGVGGVSFPGGARPSYADFAYLAFTVGMCFQVSDAAIESAQIRSAVLLHAVLSFAYNTAILAFALNLVFGAAG
ncbi:MAG: hypothetical protein NVS2B9_16340 [Myxococcales bacterium]